MNPIDKSRYYEVVELHESDAFHRPHPSCHVIGVIVQPEEIRRPMIPGYRTGYYKVIDNRGRLTLRNITLNAARLRPLTQKEQEKINERTRQTT